MTKKQPLGNAEEIIERFGGIRPMAKKVNVAVTTVQGWKKRGNIPANRYDQVVRAAQEHEVLLDDIVGQGSSSSAQEGSATSSVANQNTQQNQRDAGFSAPPQPPAKSGIDSNILVGGGLVAAAVVAIIVLLWPGAGSQEEQQRIQELELKVQQLEEDLAEAEANDGGFFGALVPEGLRDKIGELEAQAQQAQDQVNAAIESAQTIGSEVFSGSPQIAALLGRFQGFTATEQGENTLDQSVSELSALLGNVQTSTGEQLDAALEQARSQSTAVSETFSGVPGQDLKAAALLLGMTQFRSALNRDNQPFEEDLALLQQLTGENNPELNAALERLAPHAEEGVLTTGGLTEELQSLTGDIVVASLKGEEVSIQERAQARFGDIFRQAEEEPELAPQQKAAEAQATLTQTETLLQQGNLAGAIEAMQSLDGPAADAAAPWLSEARASLLAQQIKDFFGKSINEQAYGSSVAPYLAQGGRTLQDRSNLIQDEASGINFLRIEKSPFESLPKASFGFADDRN